MSLASRFDLDDPLLLAQEVTRLLSTADDGELFIEDMEAETLVFDNGRLRTASFDTRRGFGLRAICGDKAGYAHSGDLTRKALGEAADTLNVIDPFATGLATESPLRTNKSLYEAKNPIERPGFAAKSDLLAEIDAYARGADQRVRQVSVSLAGSYQDVAIIRKGGDLFEDARPLVRLNVSIVVGDGDRQESGSSGLGGRHGFDLVVADGVWRGCVDEALRQAFVNLEAVAAPAGTFDVVLGPGWPGVMLHEAVGHGLEGDFNRKGTSAFSGRVGEQVAAKGVTVVDDGTIAGRRGSLTIDDEGTPSQSTTLIEDGILVGYMQDRQNAALTGVSSTGNGRRQSYAHAPMPRMTNTYMLGGAMDPAEILASVDDGVYAVSFGGGQVDITSGKYVFACTEAYRIRKGKVAEPIRGAMMIGNGPEDMHRIAMLGNDMELDPGIGMCGKQGQGVPVGVGQPTTRINQVTIGGTER